MEEEDNRIEEEVGIPVSLSPYETLQYYTAIPS